MQRKYSILYFDTKALFNLSYQEYHYLSMVYHMSTFEDWCIAPNSYFMEYLGITTDRGLQKLTLKLKDRGLLVKGKGSRRRVSDEFALSIEDGSSTESEQQDTPNSRTPRTAGHPNGRTGISEQQDGVIRTAVRKNPNSRTPNSNNSNTYTNTYNNKEERDSENKKISVQSEKVETRKDLESSSSEQQEKKEEKKKVSAQKEKPSGADLVDWDKAFWQGMDFQYTLQKWFEMMKDQYGKVFYSRDMVVERLRDLHSLLGATGDNKKESDAVEIIKTSTRKGWKDFYKDSNGKSNKKPDFDTRLKHVALTDEEREQKRIADDQSYQDEIERGKSSMAVINEILGRS